MIINTYYPVSVFATESEKTKSMLAHICKEIKAYIASDPLHSDNRHDKVSFQAGSFKVKCLDNEAACKALLARLAKKPNGGYGTKLMKIKKGYSPTTAATKKGAIKDAIIDGDFDMAEELAKLANMFIIKTKDKEFMVDQEQMSGTDTRCDQYFMGRLRLSDSVTKAYYLVHKSTGSIIGSRPSKAELINQWLKADINAFDDHVKNFETIY